MADAAIGRRLGRPPDVDSGVTRDRLVSTARHLFARDGFDATTNRDIAAAAGITTGAIYHYFSSKADLYVAVYTETIDFVYGEFERAVVHHDNLLDQYVAVLDAAGRMNDADPSVTGFVVAIAGETQRHPALAARLRSVRGRNATFFRRLVADAAERGELLPGVDQRGLADLLGAVLAGMARLSTVTGDRRRQAAAMCSLKRFLDGTLLQRVPLS